MINRKLERAVLLELSNSRISNEGYEFIAEMGVAKFIDAVEKGDFEKKFLKQYHHWLKRAPESAKNEWGRDFGKLGSLGKDEEFWYENYGCNLKVADIDRYLDGNETWFYYAERPFASMLGIVLSKEMSAKERMHRYFEEMCLTYISEAKNIIDFCLVKAKAAAAAKE